jgi:hypothetical protein
MPPARHAVQPGPSLGAGRPMRAPCFASGERTVHTDGHVEVGGAFYPVPLALLGRRLRVRWDAQVDSLRTVLARRVAGVPARQPQVRLAADRHPHGR